MPDVTAEDFKGALGSWLGDRKAGPKAHWKGGLEGGSARETKQSLNELKQLAKYL